MPTYHQLGRIPHKRHTIFRREGGGIYHEQLIGNKRFSGLSSLLYHVRPPTAVKSTQMLQRVEIMPDPDPTLRMRHFRLAGLPAGGSATINRRPILYNQDVVLSIARPDQSDAFFFRNAQADEVLFVADGEGVLASIFGELPYRKGDYLVIPRGITYRLRPGSAPHLLLVVESFGPVQTPRRYRNDHGQLLEHSPYCERDIRRPQYLPVHEEHGEFAVVVKLDGTLTEVVLDHHPFDAVGWDGYYYPWALNIGDFEPITGRVHQPPPVHQTFEAPGFVLCSFVPRLCNYHPDAVPAPYNHANVMSDEVLFYASEHFASRKDIEHASLTLHPNGLTHGPHPGAVEASLGQRETDELAVMIDTFHRLHVTKVALTVEDRDYGVSWLEARAPD